MEKDFGSWFLNQHSDWKSPDLNSIDTPFDLGKKSSVPAYMSPCTERVSADGTFPEYFLSGLPNSKPSQPKEPNGWFYCLPRFRQAFTPVPNSISKEKSPAGHDEKNCVEAVTPNPVSGCAQKRFLVFDQSGDKTTLIFSSGIGTPVQYPSSWTPKPLGDHVGEDHRNERHIMVHHSGPDLTDEYYENRGDDAGSEMREDTEEINALLFSDDDYSDEDGDEVTSTDHSPSTMTAYDKKQQFEVSEEGEEVASSDEPTKRQKLVDGSYDVPSLMDTATSVKKPNERFERCSEHEDDAESSCGRGNDKDLGEFDSSLGDKRSRKEKIRETVSVLQSIIPCGKGKDATLILDEAIHYLRSLKRKAEALGLDTL